MSSEWRVVSDHSSDHARLPTAHCPLPTAHSLVTGHRSLVTMKKERLDVLLVARGLAESRAQAQALILAGQVLVGGQPAGKPGMAVASDVALELKAGLPYVSRGGLKLAHALDAFGLAPRVAGQVALDAGASTGGFTDALLQAGAVR